MIIVRYADDFIVGPQAKLTDTLGHPDRQEQPPGVASRPALINRNQGILHIIQHANSSLCCVNIVGYHTTYSRVWTFWPPSRAAIFHPIGIQLACHLPAQKRKHFCHIAPSWLG